ncbi:KPN_02809 family neutral zinc metallopeptidase [Brachybacterium sp. J153]|uniref:KPN_02809 family neutral zinc metallopeptidase n=1 Tax=Brachybacterium sp. J153 TaxID=3116488 RepID=UPI002E786001|nr:neutral zinc metallopeptidase [Brachybacterium sp. J153]MEE1618017.1 neutral zinc metallopeptidase [Brachybacterium sp. J153]
MSFNPNAEIRSDNVARSGGGGTGGGFRPGGGGLKIGGAGGCVILVVLLVLMMTGILSPGQVMDLVAGGGTSQGQSGQGGVLEQCTSGADANADDECLVQATIESGDSLWAQLAPEAGWEFVEPQGIVFSQSVQTGCGAATADVGPFYCPADSTIYVDVDFFDSLSSRFGADGGQLAKMYVVAHEYGHHVQYLSGAMQSADRSGTGPQSDAVRLELQADCYAGVWAHHASATTDDQGQPMLAPLTDEDIASALSAASAVGDDHIQGDVAGGQVNPESWTHGSSEQRQHWFTVGYSEGTVQACDTFAVDEV